jgi:hypothetical protein
LSEGIDEGGHRDLISSGRLPTTLNLTEACHIDASHSTFIQGGQTNVFSKTSNTYIVSGATLGYLSIVIDTNADL